MRPIPYGRSIRLSSVADGCAMTVRDGALALAEAGETPERFDVVDRGLGRAALRVGRLATTSYVSVLPSGETTLRVGEPGDAETFQWMETVYGDLLLMSLVTHRYVQIAPSRSAIFADRPGPRSDRSDGACLRWE